MNIPPNIGVLISRRIATLKELQTFYGVRDLYLMLEVHAVDSHNRALARKHQNANRN